MKLTTALTIAAAALVAGLLLEHHVGPLGGLVRLLHGPAASTEQDAEDAGRKAAEDIDNELDTETDDAVAAGSDVADQHAADAVERDAADAADEQRARADLDRRLHAELQERVGEGSGAVQRITHADIDGYLDELGSRLRQRAGLAGEDGPDDMRHGGDESGG